MKKVYIFLILALFILSGCSKNKVNYDISKEKLCQESCNNIGGLYISNEVVKENKTYIEVQCSCNIYKNITK